MVPATIFGIRELVALAVRTFVAGGVMGALFALAVARWDSGRQIGELRYGRFASWGFLGGAAIVGALGLMAPGLLPAGVLLAGAAGLGAIAAGFSVTTLAFVRRGAGLSIVLQLKGTERHSLPPPG